MAKNLYIIPCLVKSLMFSPVKTQSRGLFAARPTGSAEVHQSRLREVDGAGNAPSEKDDFTRKIVILQGKL